MWQNLPWASMAGPLAILAALFITGVIAKVILMFYDPIYRDKLLYGKKKEK